MVTGNSQSGAPYSKPAAGKIRVCCANWENEGCEVRPERKKSAQLASVSELRTVVSLLAAR